MRNKLKRLLNLQYLYYTRVINKKAVGAVYCFMPSVL